MRAKGFSFACPNLVSREDETFQRFLKTAKAEPTKVHNPFPQLACPSDFEQARTQPLIKISYLPTSELYIPDIYYSKLELVVTDLHEWVHVQNDITPAKMLARVISARAYAYLNGLLNGESWDEEGWRELVAMNARLSAICRAITLSEELLAIALSFSVVAEKFSSSKERVELEKLEKKSVKKYQKLSRDFEVLYYKTFKKVVGWFHESRGSLWQYLGMFLQGIRPTGSGFEVVDSERRCRILAEKAKGMKNGAELISWIGRTTIQPTHEFEAGLAAQAILVDPREFSNEEGSWLWTVAKGRRPPTRVRNSFQVVWKSNFFEPNFLQMHLRTHESDRDWFVVLSILNDFFKGSRAQRMASHSLVRLESLRQQLDEGKGICCPFYKPGKCNCTSSWQETLLRVLQWASEGKFGDGEWRDLPPECASRN